jgi:hypothetical protein
MSLRSYQSLENGETKLNLERLERIAGILEANMEELLSPEGYYIHLEIKDGSSGSGVGTGNTYNYNFEKEVLDKMFASKNDEVRSLKEEIKLLTEENKYLKDKIDQFMELLGKKGNRNKYLLIYSMFHLYQQNTCQAMSLSPFG